MSLSLELLQESEEEYDPIDNGNTSDSDEADVQQVPYQEELSKCSKCESSFSFKGSLR